MSLSSRRFGGRLTRISHGRSVLAVGGATAAALALAVPAASQATAISGHSVDAKSKVKNYDLIGSGSSAAQVYMTALFSAYEKLHHNIRFTYTPDGGNAGVQDVQSGKSQFAIQTAPPVPANSGTVFNKLFLDGLCIDVNSSNAVSNISLGDLKNIFTGVDTSWSQISGSNLNSTIDPFGRTPTAGQYTFFKSAVLGSSSQAEPLVQEESQDGLVAQAVKQDANGIGYVGLANSAQHGEKAVSVGGVSCTAANIRAKTYPLFRWDYGVFPHSHPSPQVEQFFAWVQTSAAAGKIINTAGAVAYYNAK